MSDHKVTRARLGSERVLDVRAMNKITVTANGPYLVESEVPLANQHIVTNAQGDSLEWRQGDAIPHSKKYALCRCGQSRTKPFCDGAHTRIGSKEQKRRAASRTRDRRSESMVRRWCSKTPRHCVRSRASVIPKDRCGIS